MSAADQLAEALTAERDDAVRGMTSALRLVCDLRWALGDRGGRMQPELLEFARQMRKDAERYRWLRDNGTSEWGICVWGDDDQEWAQDIRAADVVDREIDAAMELHNAKLSRDAGPREVTNEQE